MRLQQRWGLFQFCSYRSRFSFIMNTTTLTENSLKHRSLPRELLKWIQGLDLSYSVRDFRRDLKNGFLVGEIFSRYYPGKIQMHSFDNSHNSQRKRNNWALIEHFLDKNDIPISKEEYHKIQNDDPEQLYEFMCRIYTILTQRKLVIQPLPEITTQSIRNENMTNSFLIKSGGMERVEVPLRLNEQMDVDTPSNHEDGTNSPTRKTNFLKIPVKQITPIVEKTVNQIDIKSVNIRTVNDNRRDSLNRTNNSQPSEQTSQPLVEEEEPSLFPFLNNILESNLKQEEYQPLLEHFDSKSSLNSSFLRKILVLNPEFVCLFWDQILASKEGLLTRVFVNQQEMWKFNVFLVGCMHRLDVSHPGFSPLLGVMQEFIEDSARKDRQRTKEFCQEYLLPMIINEIKITEDARKRVTLMGLLSRLGVHDHRKATIALFKVSVNDITLLMELLSLFLQEDDLEGSDKGLVDMYISYANAHLLSNSLTLRCFSYKMFMKIAESNFVFALKTFKPLYESLPKTTNWENMSQVVILLTILLTKITSSREYLTLIKQSTSISRTYNPDNERMANQMKEEIHDISKLLQLCAQHTDRRVKEVILAGVAPILGIDPLLANLFLALWLELSPEEQKDILANGRPGKVVEESRTQLQIKKVEIDCLRRATMDIIQAVTQHIKQNTPTKPDENLIGLLVFCLDNLNTKEHSIDAVEKTFAALVSLLLSSISQATTPGPLFNLLSKIHGHYFTSTIRLPDYTERLSTFMTRYSSNQTIYNHFLEYFRGLAGEYQRSFNPVLKEFLDNLQSKMHNKNPNKELEEMVRALTIEQIEN